MTATTGFAPFARSTSRQMTSEARAEQAKPLADAEARREVVLTETEVAELVAKRRDKELDAEIRRTADAQRYAGEQAAEAARYRVKAEAEAARDRRLLEAEAERANLEATAAGRAFEERELGRAKAEATLSIGEAEAAAMSRKAEAYKEYGEAATLELLVSRLPDVARAIAEPIGNVKDITIIDTEGANKLTRTTANTVRQIDSVLESFTGASLSDLVGRYIEKGGNGNGDKRRRTGDLPPEEGPEVPPPTPR